MIEIKKIPYQQTWPIRQKVMWPDKPLEYVKLEKDPSGQHFALYNQDEIKSIISFFINDNDAQFRKFATLTNQQGKGYGSKLLRFVMDELHANKLTRIWCNARLDKAQFYERFGLKKTNQTFVKGGIEYIIMEKLLA